MAEGEFVAELRAEGTGYWAEHPFQRAMLAGELTDSQVRGFVANRWYYQKWLPRKDAAIIANCPEPEVRRRWLERIVYHDGTKSGEGGMADWLVLCDAVGLDRAEVLDDRNVVPGVRFAVDSYVAFARAADWVSAVASSLTELFAPDVMSKRIDAFREHYPWIDPPGLAYFERRCARAPVEAAYALEVVTRYADTDERRAAAVDALRRKCEVLWSMLDAIDYAYRS